jgi:hemolysin III
MTTKQLDRDYPIGEEIANSITHGIGTLLSIAGLVILIVWADMNGDAWHITSFSIFGGSLIFLYLASTLYHSLTGRKTKAVFARLDHVAIFILIAGTYTPIVLTTLRGPWGWTLFGIIWGLALFGIILRSIYLEKYKYLSLALYLGMGWLFVIALPKVIEEMPAISLDYLVYGGVAYTVGVVFYVWKKLPYNHAIWHLFVLTGSILHFFSILYSV